MWLSCVGLHTHPDAALFRPAHCQHVPLVTVDSACLSHSFSQMSQIYKFFDFMVIFPGPQKTNDLFHLTTLQTSISIVLKAWIKHQHGNTTVKFFLSNNKMNYWQNYSSQQLMKVNLCYSTGEVRATKPSLPFNLMQHYKSYKV